jgi:peptidoglycan hydrolase-like protein with peptidoglycan-binding domain
MWGWPDDYGYGYGYGDPGYPPDGGYGDEGPDYGDDQGPMDADGASPGYGSAGVPQIDPAGPGGLTMAVQTALARRGYHPGPATGVLGEETRRAITHFQEENGLKPTGRVNGPLLDALGLR